MIEIIFIVALVVLFLHVCTWEGMIFDFVGNALDNLSPNIKKPLFDCPICMVPWWGSLIILIANITGVWDVYGWFAWVLILFAAAGLNTVLIYIISSEKE